MDYPFWLLYHVVIEVVRAGPEATHRLQLFSVVEVRALRHLFHLPVRPFRLASGPERVCHRSTDGLLWYAPPVVRLSQYTQ